MTRFDPRQVGWRLGKAHEPRGGDLWVPWDRTAGVIGPQGSGKTLDLLIPALLAAPGAALVTLTKADDLLLSIGHRSTNDRPCVVLDPFGLAPGLPELVWDPIAGCVDPMVAEKRAKAFTAGTVSGAGARGQGDDAARFYAAEAAKVIQGYFHAAALTGPQPGRRAALGRQPRRRRRTHRDPARAPARRTVLARTAPRGAAGGRPHRRQHHHHRPTSPRPVLPGGDPPPLRPRTGTPGHEHRRRHRGQGTIYLLGRESPYESASPLMTAVAEHVLDTALTLATRSRWGRLCPPMLACLDELPSTAPLPTLQTRMANERALGISFIWAAQTRAQLTQIFGEHQARAVLGLTNTLVLFGGSKDVAFNQEISDLLGPVRVARTTWQSGRSHRSVTGEDIPILTGAEVRQLTERHALVVAENGKPLIARLTRCIDGNPDAPCSTPTRPGTGSPPPRPGRSPLRRAPPQPSSKPAATDSTPTQEARHEHRTTPARSRDPWRDRFPGPGGSSTTPTGS
jgi:type IV secretion system protein VirD4